MGFSLRRVAILLLAAVAVGVSFVMYQLLGPDLLLCRLLPRYQSVAASAWCGRYQLYLDDDTLVLRPDGSFIQQERAQPNVTCRTWGVYRVHGGDLHLRPSFRFVSTSTGPWTQVFQVVEYLSQAKCPIRPSRYHFFTWGTLRCLVKDTDLIYFLNILNAGKQSQKYKPPYGIYLLDPQMAPPLDRRPDLPGRLSSLLLNRPVTGRVLSVTNTFAVTLTVDAPNKLRFGSLLYCWSPGRASASKVMVIEASTSHVVAYAPSSQVTRPEAGQLVSTRVPDIKGWSTVASIWEN